MDNVGSMPFMARFAIYCVYPVYAKTPLKWAFMGGYPWGVKKGVFGGYPGGVDLGGFWGGPAGAKIPPRARRGKFPGFFSGGFSEAVFGGLLVLERLSFGGGTYRTRNSVPEFCPDWESY